MYKLSHKKEQEGYKWVMCNQCAYWYETSSIDFPLLTEKQIKELTFICRMCKLEAKLESTSNKLIENKALIMNLTTLLESKENTTMKINLQRKLLLV